MAFWDKAQALLQKIRPQQEEQDSRPQMMSNRADGGFSGYQPNVGKQQRRTAQPGQATAQQPTMGSFQQMMPPGVEMNGQQFRSVGGQTGNYRAQAPGGAPQGTGYQQPVQNTGYRPQPQPQQPQQQQAAPYPGQSAQRQTNWQGTGYQPPVQNTGYRPQQPQQQSQNTGYGPTSMNPPNTYFTQQGPAQGGYQPQYGFGQQPQQPPFQQQPQPQQPQQPPQPQQQQPQRNNVTYWPGSFTDSRTGEVFRMVVRVSQVTSVPSCYELIDFMQNREVLLVNAEKITDLVEAQRCLDLLFGASRAMGLRFVRVSGMMIYLIAPADVQVQMPDSFRAIGDEDLRRHWPENVNPVRYVNVSGDSLNPDDFTARNYRTASHASTRAQNSGYTDYGGFQRG